LEATGWRSSNAPHWTGEPADVARTTSLAALVADPAVAFFDVVRSNADGGRIRRQLVKVDDRFWLVLDAFKSQTAEEPETVWRFSPDVSIEPSAPDTYRLKTVSRSMSLRLGGFSGWTAEADPNGSASWNSGLLSNGGIAPSPAIRVSAPRATSQVLVAVFGANSAQEVPVIGAIELRWDGTADWRVTIGSPGGTGVLAVERATDRLVVASSDATPVERKIVAAREQADRGEWDAETAFANASKRYGNPFQLLLERRIKVTMLIVFLAAAQFIVFRIARSRYPRLLPALLLGSAGAWLALALFLATSFLD
jgi:hypothetical protein